MITNLPLISMVDVDPDFISQSVAVSGYQELKGHIYRSNQGWERRSYVPRTYWAARVRLFLTLALRLSIRDASSAT